MAYRSEPPQHTFGANWGKLLGMTDGVEIVGGGVIDASAGSKILEYYVYVQTSAGVTMTAAEYFSKIEE